MTVLQSPLSTETVFPVVCHAHPPIPVRHLERNSIHQDLGKERLARPCPIRICPHASASKASSYTPPESLKAKVLL